MSGMALRSWFGKNNQSEALVKAPSMDLIRSDNELVMPELEEIQLPSIEVYNFDEYMELAKSVQYNPALEIAQYLMLSKLKEHGFSRYPKNKVEKFLDKQVKLMSSRTNGLTYPEWLQIINYYKALPPRILKIIKKIDEIMDIDKTETDESKKYSIWLSNLRISNITTENGQEICFLMVDIKKPDNNWSAAATVIDAWRGLTFSDEEAKI